MANLRFLIISIQLVLIDSNNLINSLKSVELSVNNFNKTNQLQIQQSENIYKCSQNINSLMLNETDDIILVDSIETTDIHAVPIKKYLLKDEINALKFSNENTDVDIDQIKYLNLIKKSKHKTKEKPITIFNYKQRIILKWYSEEVVGRFTRKPTTFVLIERNILEIKNRIVRNFHAPFWNRKAFFQIIVNLNIEDFSIQLFTRLLVQFYQIFNFVIILTEANSTHVEIVTIKNKITNCAKSYNTLKLNCSSESLGQRLQQLIIDDEVIDSFKGCEFRALGVKGPNQIGLSLMKVFSSKINLNFSIETIENFVIHSLSNADKFNPNQIIKSYISVNTYGTPENVALFHSIPEAYIYNSVALLMTPAAKPIAPWKMAIYSLSAEFWLASFASFIIVSIVFWISERKKYGLYEYMFDVFSINFMNALPREVPPSFRIRILLICCIFYSMHFVIAISTGYFDALVEPYNEPQIKTLNGLKKLKTRVIIQENHFYTEGGAAFANHIRFPGLKRVWPSRGQHFLDPNPNEKCYYATDREILTFGLYYRKCFKVYFNPEVFTFRWFSYNIFFKQAIFVPNLKIMILIMHQAGFSEHFDPQRKGKVLLPGEYWSDKRYCDLVSEAFALKMEHVIVPFVALVIGALVCSLILVLEILNTNRLIAKIKLIIKSLV